MGRRARVTRPIPAPQHRRRKRLIILCDGTGQDSTGDVKTVYPTNVTRLARAISPWAEVKDPEQSDTKEEVEQIVYYQKGVGTNSKVDWVFGGASGAGVSANIRAAFAFLSHNYDPGDEICLFGFSRGAYTARAIAGMVTEVGLLTKRGMDHFPDLYDTYRAWRLSGCTDGHATRNGNGHRAEKAYRKMVLDYEAEGRLCSAAADAVQIVGVWDTVGFYIPFVGRLFGYKEEEIKFTEHDLSAKIKYGFHALSLDERRKQFRPTLWELPVDETREGQTMKQVWFSGRHSDVGGGETDPHLSDIAFAWMIAECEKTGLLAFDDHYCLQAESTNSRAWGTTKGSTEKWFWEKSLLSNVNSLLNLSRLPMSSKYITNEEIHASIEDRKFGSNAGDKEAKYYPCLPLTGSFYAGQWQLNQSKRTLRVAQVDAKELQYRGNIRPATV